MADDHIQYRKSIVDALKDELFGPSVESDEERLNEALLESPLQLYSTGILFPQRSSHKFLEDSGKLESVTEATEDIEQTENDVPKSNTARAGFGSTIFDDEEEHPLNLANQFNPSSLGITFKSRNCSSLTVNISCGIYSLERQPNPDAGKRLVDGTEQPSHLSKKKYQRKHLTSSITIQLSSILSGNSSFEIPETDGKLVLRAMLRSSRKGENIVSLMMVNTNLASDLGSPDLDEVFFQTEFSVRDENSSYVFAPIDRPRSTMVLSDTEQSTEDSTDWNAQLDNASMDLLYRQSRAYCFGHGCAGDWNRNFEVRNTGLTDEVRTSSLPMYEVKPVAPREQPYGKSELNLSLQFLSGGPEEIDNQRCRDSIIEALQYLCDDYKEWIEDQEKLAIELNDPLFKKTAASHLQKCRDCLERMCKGVEVLANEKDDTAFTAFRIANRAMLMQQVHTSLPKRLHGTPLPDFSKIYEEQGANRKWRPFQLAFVLMNVADTGDSADGAFSQSAPRSVDLIWFPTGGGKTEAYLGVAAFHIVRRRLNNPANAGTTVLMRYTLRLLTAQQFQRASALMMALDELRTTTYLNQNLGDEAISIGLWVGDSLSPNKRKSATVALNAIRKSRSHEKARNPFQVLACPWCGCDMNDRANLGYREERVLSSKEKTVKFRCPDSQCAWGSKNMPIVVIDDDIFEKPPTLVLGTVDKFVQVAWINLTGRLFGIDTPYDPPDLIIQDELHLISGPLGTIVGLFEMVIEKFCTRGDKVPKIIASTATIRNADEQCWALYQRKAFAFPPQGLTAGDSYFAYEDEDSPGRLYTGVFASGLKSHATAQVRVCSSLLQAAVPPSSAKESDREDEEFKPGQYFPLADPYGTLVWYFNSLRELGHATTMCTGDITEYIKGLARRRNIPRSHRRTIWEYVELTSRRDADEIPEILNQLERQWVPRRESADQTPIDILLATNMISVGVDVPRLGLMVVTGQPKSTSEYIQATSRVGRQHPGLVVCVYHQNKSRDRSHYEQFVSYHQSFYRFVEPTSVTPFSPPARERGLRAALIAIARLSMGMEKPSEIKDKRPLLEKEIEPLLDRISHIDPDEASDARNEVQQALNEWEAILPDAFGQMGGTPQTTTLTYPYGSRPDPEFQKDAWPIPMSMRNVDSTSRAYVINQYLVDD